MTVTAMCDVENMQTRHHIGAIGLAIVGVSAAAQGRSEVVSAFVSAGAPPTLPVGKRLRGCVSKSSCHQLGPVSLSDGSSSFAGTVAGSAQPDSTTVVSLGMRVGIAPAFISVALAAARRRRASGSNVSRRSATKMFYSSNNVADIAETTDDQVIAALEREAATLRADAAGLEALQQEQLLLDRQKLFKAFNAYGNEGVDVAAIIGGMKEFAGTELDEHKAMQLLSDNDANSNGRLEFEEFDMKALRASYTNILAENRAKEIEAREASLLADKEALDRVKAAELEKLQDTSFPIRLGSVLAYVLPLVDGLRFGLPLAMQYPALHSLFDILVLPGVVLSQVPFALGQLALFILMQSLADNQSLPTLLRFNLRQAIALDIALFIPNILNGLGSMLFQNQIPEDISLAASTFVFALLSASILYSQASSLLGVVPDGIPGVSAYVKGSTIEELNSQNGQSE